ncbi:MAG: hypothetical protein N2560_01695 [Ignavibacteria bacterium]|nr:hypothetical protein [Ignavibacteria bacterium]
MSEEDIKNIYDLISQYYEQYLKSKGVTLPKLFNSKGKFTKNSLVLVYLARNYPHTRVVSKEELTEFVRRFYPNTNDVQQARHLASQNGWFIVSGTRGNGEIRLEYGKYQLITLEKPYPNFNPSRREQGLDKSWEEIKKGYDFRCATCGSKEGEHHFHWKNAITELQKGHIDPKKPLNADNIIPQCQFCNRAYRNFWIFDKYGRVRKIAKPKMILKFADEKVQFEIYKILYNKFKGKNPND